WTLDEAGDEAPKFGAYTDDLRIFDWLRAEAPGRRRPIEAQVMDLSDDIAYSVHDVEDGVFGGWFALDPDQLDAKAVWHVARDWYNADADDDRLDAALDRLQWLPEWPKVAFDGGRRARAVLKSLTSALIGRFASAAQEATVTQWGSGPLVRFEADLEVPLTTRDEITVLKSIAAHYVMRSDDRAAHLRLQQEILASLVTVLINTGDEHLEAEFVSDFAAARDDDARRRVIIDQVASLTDVSAHAWAVRLLA
ncbi:MAG: deoxyguanosinetriphosphate triphosphohydrolase, partial [Aeromicrobium sp.]